MFFRHHSDKIILPIIFVIVLFASSYRGKYHLKSDMPAAFFGENLPSKKTSLDEKIARAYWKSAQMNIQWRYPYSSPLPPDPPAIFQVNAPDLEPSASNPATRLLYWQHLQRVWYSPEIWQKDYAWDFSWISDPLAAGGTWLKNTTERSLGAR
jgi:hypothetical protein